MNSKRNIKSNLKLCIRILVIFQGTVFAQDSSEKYTEKDWVNYAKAQAYAYSFNINAINSIFVKENSTFRDSIAAIDIFKPLIVKGVTVRETSSAAPILNGAIRYYNLNGIIIGEINFN
jgi:hypothetical protein